MYPYAILKIGGEGILYFYDLFLAIGVIAALLLADRMTVKRGFSVTLQRLVIVCVVAAVVLGYGAAVLFQAVYNYLGDPASGFRIDSDTGATFQGGLIGGALTYVLVYFIGGKYLCKDGEEKKRFPDMLDIAAVCIPLAHAFGRLGCLFGGCCHGAETDAWYGITMIDQGVKVVPVQLFESLFLFALSGGLIALFFKNTGDKKFPLMPVYCVGYGIWRFFIEFARADDRGATVIPFLTPSQLISLIMFLIGVGYFALWFFKLRKKASAPCETAEEELNKE
ncbi:MAG: prolipoprotein diacylglyceryl transferase [Clostridia bacterium]|nr:prolipoprotein diacylglyceryl transferase [Clostridia bacterium]